MRCYYEILNVPRDASESDIKTAYKKLALKWHPDKNLENTENAKEQFQFVQQAYEVLSDRQERAWYDNHREQILRGANSEFKDDSLNVYQYFTTSCFKGYMDDEKGFYTVYRKVFEEISKEDMEFMEHEEYLEIPTFGNSQSDYEEIVGPFYSYWSSYTTKKSYVWLDPYDIKEIRDRRLFKHIEKENKKVRLKAKKERNEEVRSLVSFVKKRDKRVQAYLKKHEEKIKENRKKQKDISFQKRLERKKEIDSADQQAEWSKFDHLHSELEEIEKQLAKDFGEELSNSECGEESEGEPENLYCITCNKVFKTPKALANHELSRKHKENVEILRQYMLNENDMNEVVEKNSEGENKEYGKKHDEKQKTKNEAFSDELSGVDHELSDVEQEMSDANQTSNESDLEKHKKEKKKNKKKKNVIKLHIKRESDFLLYETRDIITKQNETIHKSTEEKSNEDEIGNKNMSSSADVSLIKDSDKKLDRNSDEITNILSKSLDIMEESDRGTKEHLPKFKDADNKLKVKKNKQKSAKKTVKCDTSINAEFDTDHCCVMCKANFPSKNKLFDHLKKTGHSVYLPKNENIKENKKKKSKEK